MKAVNVYPISGNKTKLPLTYFSSKEYTSGDFVYVTVQNRKTIGIVGEVRDIASEKSELKQSRFALKKIASSFGPTVFSDAYTKALIALSSYYGVGLGYSAYLLLPSYLLEKKYFTLPPIKKESGKKITSEYIEQAEDKRILFYKKTAEKALTQNKNILIITPTHDLASFFYKTLSTLLPKGKTILQTGEVTKKQREENLSLIFEKDTPHCIIGTPSALFLPIPRLSTIIVEHEHSHTYEQPQFPFFDGRVVAEAIATARNIPILFADSFVRIETKVLYTSKVAIEEAPGRIILQNQAESKEHTTLSLIAKNAITKTLENNGSVFIFAFRKGYAGTTICRDCGEGVRCPHCNKPLTLRGSEAKKIFECTACKKQIDPHIKCKNCNSWNIMPIGIGVDKVVEELRDYIPKDKLFVIDGDTKKRDTKNQLTLFEKSGGVLVGNEAVLLRLHTKSTIAIIASLDSLFSIPSYSANERIGNIIFKVMEKTEGKVLLQTRYPDEAIFECIATGKMQPFIKNEIATRKALHYPPYGTLFSITLQGGTTTVEKYMKLLKEGLQEYLPHIKSVEKQAGKITSTITIKLPREVWSIESLLSPSKQTALVQSLLAELPKEALIKINK